MVSSRHLASRTSKEAEPNSFCATPTVQVPSPCASQLYIKAAVLPAPFSGIVFATRRTDGMGGVIPFPLKQGSNTSVRSPRPGCPSFSLFPHLRVECESSAGGTSAGKQQRPRKSCLIPPILGIVRRNLSSVRRPSPPPPPQLAPPPPPATVQHAWSAGNPSGTRWTGNQFFFRQCWRCAAFFLGVDGTGAPSSMSRMQLGRGEISQSVRFTFCLYRLGHSLH